MQNFSTGSQNSETSIYIQLARAFKLWISTDSTSKVSKVSCDLTRDLVSLLHQGKGNLREGKGLSEPTRTPQEKKPTKGC